MQNLKKNWSAFSKMTRTWWNLTQALESFQNFHFHLLLLCIVFNVWPKTFQVVIFYDIEGWCKIWRKTALWFRKWHEEYGKFSLEHSKMSELELWWDPLSQSRKGMTLKFKEELCVMAMKIYTKIEEELTCRFKIDMRNLMNFDSNTWKSHKISFWCAPFEQSIYCLS